MCTYVTLSHCASQKWYPHLCWRSRFSGLASYLHHLGPPPLRSLLLNAIILFEEVLHQTVVVFLVFVRKIQDSCTREVDPRGRSLISRVSRWVFTIRMPVRRPYILCAPQRRYLFCAARQIVSRPFSLRSLPVSALSGDLTASLPLLHGGNHSTCLATISPFYSTFCHDGPCCASWR